MLLKLAAAAMAFAMLSGCSSGGDAKPANSSAGWRAQYWTWARSRHADWPPEVWEKIQGEHSPGLTPEERDVQAAAYDSNNLEGAKRELERREAISGSRDRAWVDARRDHPEWSDTELQNMQAGIVWAGMTEEQFLLTMKELNPRTKWHISDSDDFRIYIDDGTNDNFTFSQKSKKLKLWKITPR